MSLSSLQATPIWIQSIISKHISPLQQITILMRCHWHEQGVSDSAHSWRQMNNTFGAAWDLYDLYPPPFDLRLRDSVGRTVIVE